MTMNLLTDAVFTVTGGDKLSLPEIFAAMGRGEVRGFTALRPHQRPAWHMFLVQLATLALWKADREDLPMNATDWIQYLRALTPEYPDDEPWRLVVADPAKPAFLQPPVPDPVSNKLKWSSLSTPDAVDMLITSRNHDLKQQVAKNAALEDWVFALISLQTYEGFGGRGNYGIARMNGGSSSRPMLGLVPTQHGSLIINPSLWWARDVQQLLTFRKNGGDNKPCTVGGPALLWCLDWPEGGQLELVSLDPWFIEVCRRIRLVNEDGKVTAQRSTSIATRVNAKIFNGAVGDPWAPTHRAEGKSFTLSRGYDYKTLCDLLFSGDWKSPPLLERTPAEESSDMLLIAEGVSRGNSKTEGFHSRVLLVPENAIPLFSSNDAARLSKAQMDEIKGFDKALGNALALVAARGDSKARKKEHYAFGAPARSRFDRKADQIFFPSLWRRVEAASANDNETKEEAKSQFLRDLWESAEKEMNLALPAIPCTAIHRPRAEARALRVFRNTIWKIYPELFEKERVDADT